MAEVPGESALFLDFDGTLAPIVDDPAAAVPLPGVPELLARLASRLGLVVVVSGRPVAYLAAVLGPPAGLQLAGLYGMERLGAGGVVEVDEGARRWRPVLAGVGGEARRAAPAGVVVEEKGLATTIHWRGNPGAEGWARSFAGEAMARTGLVGQPGRMALELRPPVPMDKGTVVDRLGPGHRAVACFGDDLGDLPAFAALDRLAAAGIAVARVAVVDDESPPEVAAAADVVVRGPREALALLGLLAGPDRE